MEVGVRGGGGRRWNFEGVMTDIGVGGNISDM